MTKGGGFKYMFDFHLLFGEMIQFDKYSSNEFETIN